LKNVITLKLLKLIKTELEKGLLAILYMTYLRPAGFKVGGKC